MVGVCGVAAASAGIVEVTGGSMSIIAQQGDPFTFDYVSVPVDATVPQYQSGTATAGASTGDAGYYVHNYGIALWSAFERDGSYMNDSMLSQVSLLGGLNFTVDQDSSYVLTGFHALSGEQRVSMQVSLMDLTDDIQLCRDYQYSENAPDELLRLGQPDGEFNSFTGSATGSVVAGHEYSLSFSYQLVNSLGADDGASSLGAIGLVILPEPSTALLMALGLLGVLRRR
jgi:hypothetical protein